MIRRIANAVAALEGLAFIATLVFGVGALGYVVVKWTMQFIERGLYFYAVTLCGIALGVSLLACLRVPVAQLALLGAAIVVGVGFVTGTQSTLLP
jgi:hypothetical protein